MTEDERQELLLVRESLRLAGEKLMEVAELTDWLINPQLEGWRFRVSYARQEIHSAGWTLTAALEGWDE